MPKAPQRWAAMSSRQKANSSSDRFSPKGAAARTLSAPRVNRRRNLRIIRSAIVRRARDRPAASVTSDMVLCPLMKGASPAWVHLIYAEGAFERQPRDCKTGKQGCITEACSIGTTLSTFSPSPATAARSRRRRRFRSANRPFIAASRSWRSGSAVTSSCAAPRATSSPNSARRWWPRCARRGIGARLRAPAG